MTRTSSRASVGGIKDRKRKTAQTHTSGRIHPREPVSSRAVIKPAILRHPLRPPATVLTLRRTPLLVDNHAAPLALSPTAMFEFEFARDQVDRLSLCGRERAREGEFVAEGVGGEEEDARVQFEGRRVVHVEVVWRAGERAREGRVSGCSELGWTQKLGNVIHEEEGV